MSTIDNPAATLALRMDDYKNYPSLPGETYHSRRRRLEGMIDNEIRASGGDPYSRNPRIHDESAEAKEPLPGESASEAASTGTQAETAGTVEDAEAARAQRRAQTDAERSGEAGERVEVPFKGHPPALPHKDDIPEEVKAHGDKAGRPLVLAPASGTSPMSIEAAMGKVENNPQNNPPLTTETPATEIPTAVKDEAETRAEELRTAEVADQDRAQVARGEIADQIGDFQEGRHLASSQPELAAETELEGGELKLETTDEPERDEKARVREQLVKRIEEEENRTDRPKDFELIAKLQEKLRALDSNELGSGASIDTGASPAV